MPDSITDERAAVLGVLRSAKGAMGPKMVHEAIPGSSYGSVKNMLPALAEDGYLEKEGHGRYVFVTDDLVEAEAVKRERALASGPDEARGTVTTKRPHVVLDDSAPRPDPHRLLVARIYNTFGEFVGFRYAVTDLQRVPYEIVLHPDGTEEVRQPDPVNREAA